MGCGVRDECWTCCGNERNDSSQRLGETAEEHTIRPDLAATRNSQQVREKERCTVIAIV